MAVRLEGPLSKWTNVVKGWQYRWFVLDENTGLLSYYTSKSKMMRGTRRGCLRLWNAQIGIDDEDDSTFTISSDQKTFHFQARDAIERSQWVKALEDTIRRHSKNNDLPNCFTVATEEEVNHRLAEAEAYFRMLTQQVKTIEEQIDASPNGNCERLVLLKESMLKMLEAIGQVLEILHTAKSTLARKVPVPILQSDTPDGGSSKPLESITRSDDKKVAHHNGEAASITSSPLVSSGEHQAEDNDLHVLGNSPSAEMRRLGVPLETVPCVSFSSSEDEDNDMEFFDANEYHDYGSEDDLQLSISVMSTSDSQYATPSSPKVEDSFSLSSQQSSKLPRTHSDSFFDDEDEGAPDDGDGSLAGHGSVITHLLSQVKIGMDLTKVTLPTFILERRSLLEMYADFFAHPDLFVNIPDLQTPEERMIQVLRWYLSSFHAGRKGSVAKKPYNPILGEVFECVYQLPQSTEEVSADGPVSWARKGDVAFVAEQVSHHPPISAFYAECVDKRVSFNCHIWTKSKFLGLSIGVHMVGTGHCHILDWDEEYVMTFPNGYGRSILTVPWVEMGGQTEITCSKTGYSCKIDFHTKPFYGGKKNRLTAEVFAPGERKSTLTVNGEWNGVMYSTRPGRKEPEVFVDTFTMPTVSKRVRAIDKQEPHESRRLWRDVTSSLKENRIDDATAGKHKLEEKQRADARERKETNTKWINRIFSERDERFVYNSPLHDRLNSKKE